MSKTQDIHFDNEEKFLKDNPAFGKVVPNYPAIRAVLRAGAKLEGVKLVAMPDSED